MPPRSAGCEPPAGSNTKIASVCAGIAQRYDLDPTVVRAYFMAAATALRSSSRSSSW
ncbi:MULTISPECIES: PspC domain-containing protein [unclassified Corynebacterium]|uniref:PspC domain-containing protein n=1 Tax=Corynebacterium TaxID=1716 RepID=UPI0009EB1AB4|nr:PspC domain-containing protein [Corynebacterium phoceense]